MVDVTPKEFRALLDDGWSVDGTLVARGIPRKSLSRRVPAATKLVRIVDPLPRAKADSSSPSREGESSSPST